MLSRSTLLIVGAHALEHDLPVDVHHVRVAHPAAIDDVGHLHARVQLVRLDVHGEDADLALLHVGRDDRGQAGERPGRDVFEDERAIRRADRFDLVDQAGGDVLARAVGDDA